MIPFNRYRPYTQEQMVTAFWAKVDKPAGGKGCWIWTGAKHRDGYGRAHARIDGSQRMRIYIAHRLAWRYANGAWPAADMDVCHTCDNRLCCNPEHFFLGTHLDNMRDMEAKGRNVKGEQNRKNILTEEQVRSIRQRYNRRRGRKSNIHELAAEYKVRPNTIWLAARGISWAHVK